MIAAQFSFFFRLFVCFSRKLKQLIKQNFTLILRMRRRITVSNCNDKSSHDSQGEVSSIFCSQITTFLVFGSFGEFLKVPPGPSHNFGSKSDQGFHCRVQSSNGWKNEGDGAVRIYDAWLVPVCT